MSTHIWEKCEPNLQRNVQVYMGEIWVGQGAEVIKLFYQSQTQTQADWLILRIRSVSTNQHA